MSIPPPVKPVDAPLPRYEKAVTDDHFVLTHDDVLYMQLLLQNFDAMRDITTSTTAGGRPTLAVALDLATVERLRSRMSVGHVRPTVERLRSRMIVVHVRPTARDVDAPYIPHKTVVTKPPGARASQKARKPF
jgi:hypothetical protein